MLMLVVLVCSINSTPQLADCDRTNAVRVFQLQGHFQTRTMCVAHGEAFVAMFEDKIALKNDERLVPKCLVDIDGEVKDHRPAPEELNGDVITCTHGQRWENGECL